MDSKSKKISKNTILLTIRMILLMGITLYTSRVVLIKLGVEDFGIYNVLGSLAVTFGFFSTALINATQRFLTIEIGKNNFQEASDIFKLHLTCYLMIAMAILFFAEIIGNYVIMHKLTIPVDRLNAAYWTFHFAVFTVLVNLITVPFEAIMVAYEDMDVYAYIGIVETVLKLLAVFLLSVIPFDRLVIYAFLMFLLSLCSRFFFVLYSRVKYKECKIGLLWDRNRVKTTLGFVLWNFISTAQAALSDQGISLLLNVFVGPIANAARGINAQVGGAVFKLTNNILIAIQPQMVKSYATNDTDYLKKLFFYSSRFSFLALWFLVAPIIFCTEGILGLWLKEIPQWTSSFIKIGLVGSLFYILSKPIWSIVVASGKLKRYVICNLSVTVLMFAISIVSLKRNGDPTVVYIINAVCSFLATAMQLIVVRRYIKYSFYEYAKDVIRPILSVIVLAVPIFYIVVRFVPQQNMGTILSCFMICVANCVMILLVGLQKHERTLLLKKVRREG